MAVRLNCELRLMQKESNGNLPLCTPPIFLERLKKAMRSFRTADLQAGSQIRDLQNLKQKNYPLMEN
jgi:hypothetical protein